MRMSKRTVLAKTIMHTMVYMAILTQLNRIKQSHMQRIAI